MGPSDPRVFFASERTLLAWLRTGIAIVGLGFIVERFGLFMQLVAAQAPAAALRGDASVSSVLGIAFVLIGGGVILVATVQHGRFIATLPEIDRPAAYSRSWALWIGGFVALASFALALFLALRFLR